MFGEGRTLLVIGRGKAYKTLVNCHISCWKIILQESIKNLMYNRGCVANVSLDSYTAHRCGKIRGHNSKLAAFVLMKLVLMDF